MIKKYIPLFIVFVFLVIACNNISKINIERSNEYVNISIDYLNNKNFKNALIYVNKAIIYNPENAEAYYQKASIFSTLLLDNDELSSTDSIITNCLKAITINPHLDSVYLLLIGPYAEKNGQLEAIRLLDDGIYSNPNSSNLFFLRGIFKYGIEDYKSAETDFEKSITLNPNKDSYNYLFLGKVSFRNKDFRNGITVLSQALKIDPREIESYFWRAACYSEISKPRNAINDYTIYINKEGSEMKMQAYQNRGIDYYKIGMIDSACKDLNIAYKMGSNNALELSKKFCDK